MKISGISIRGAWKVLISFTAFLLLSSSVGGNALIVENPVALVMTESGLVAGLALPSGVKAWLGIPYVQAPVGSLRWKAPRPKTAWKGVYNADRLGPECIQKLRGHETNHYFGEEPTGENCLFMNIWAPPKAVAGSNLPVIVFIHGGGSTIGSSGMALYSGAYVAQHGAVFVNFNYRLGILGYMADPELSAESTHHVSGNYAGQDQVAALKWVHNNIEKFGGDPTRVLISGQSAGASAISALELSPLAKGLFQRVFAMSGGVWATGGDHMQTLEDAEKLGVQIRQLTKTKSIDELRQIPADQLLALVEDCQVGQCTSGSIHVGGANVDGYFLPAQPATLMASHQGTDVPVVTNFNRDESANDMRSAKTIPEYVIAAKHLYGDKSDEFLKLYPVHDAASVDAMGRAAAREALIERGARNWAIAQTQAGRSPVYVSELMHVHPFVTGILITDHPELIGAYHTSDVPYWFGTLDALNMVRHTRNWAPEDRALSQEMMSTLIAFARTGNPSTQEAKWSPWSPQSEQLMEFDISGAQMAAMDTKRLEFQRENPPAASSRTPRRLSRD